MGLIYKEGGIKLHEYIESAGHSLSNENGLWVSSNDVAVQAIIDAYDPLFEAKLEARKRVILHASTLVAAIYPFINPEKEEAIGLYEFTTDLYQTTKVNSRNALSGRLLQFKTIHDTAQTKVSEINAMTDWLLVEAYNATVGW